jgi:hypothetical protein
MEPMQFASETYSEKRLRYRLGVDPYEPQVKRSKQTALMFSLADFIGYLATCIICPGWAPFDPVGPRHFLIQAYPPRRVRRPHSESLAGLVRRRSSDLHPSGRLCSVRRFFPPQDRMYLLAGRRRLSPHEQRYDCAECQGSNSHPFFLRCLSHC